MPPRQRRIRDRPDQGRTRETQAEKYPLGLVYGGTAPLMLAGIFTEERPIRVRLARFCGVFCWQPSLGWRSVERLCAVKLRGSTDTPSDHSPLERLRFMELGKQCCCDDFGKLILRLSIGGLMLFHGVAKIMHGIDPIVAAVKGSNVPEFVAYGVYVGEVLGPLLVLIGLWTRLGALMIVADMIVALVLVHRADLGNLSPMSGAWAVELPALYLLVRWRSCSWAPDASASPVADAARRPGRRLRKRSRCSLAKARLPSKASPGQRPGKLPHRFQRALAHGGKGGEKTAHGADQ